MPDPTPTPAPKSKPAARSIANRAFLNEIADARTVATAALDPANTAALAEAELDPAIPGQINALATSIETAINEITGARGNTSMTVAQQATAREAILTALSPIQTAAKRKFTGDQESQRTAYGIAEPLASMEFDLFLTLATGALERLTPDTSTTPPTPPVDVLPGINAVKITALSDAIDLCGGKKQERTKNQEIAEQKLEKVKTDIAHLAALRREVSSHAEQATPGAPPA